MREFKIKDVLINSTLIPVDVVLTNLVRSRWPNIEKIVCVQSLKSRRVFNYHSPKRTHWVSTEFPLRDQRGKSRRARRAYCVHLVSQSKQSIRFNLRMSVRGAGYLIKVPILTDVCGEERCLMTQKLG